MFSPDSSCSTTARLRLQRAAIVMCCAASAACASPNLEPPEIARNLPPAFAASGVSAQPDDDWWNRFGDPRLAALIEEAVSESPQVGQALARVEQARAQGRIQRADQLPQVSAGLNASRAQQTLGGLGPIQSPVRGRRRASSNKFHDRELRSVGECRLGNRSIWGHPRSLRRGARRFPRQRSR